MCFYEAQCAVSYDHQRPVCAITCPPIIMTPCTLSHSQITKRYGTAMYQRLLVLLYNAIIRQVYPIPIRRLRADNLDIVKFFLINQYPLSSQRRKIFIFFVFVLQAERNRFSSIDRGVETLVLKILFFVCCSFHKTTSIMISVVERCPPLRA